MPEKYDEAVLEDFLEIPVIGELKARAIIDAGFESVGSLEEASSEELAEVEGISQESAQEIVYSLEGEGEDETEEIYCPDCGDVVGIHRESCPYCEKELKIEGDVYTQEGALNEALKVLAETEKKIKDGEESAEIWYNKGAVLEKLDADEKALKAFDRVIELDPLYDQIWTAKAHLALNLGLMNEAAKAFKVAVESRSVDIPEAALEPEEEQEIKKEHAVEIEKVVSKVAEARNALSKLRGGELPLVYLEERLDEVMEARNRDDREEVIEKGDEFLSEVSEAQKVSDLVEEGHEEIERLKEEGANAQKLGDEFEEVYSLVKGGRFDEAKREASRVLEDVIKREEKEGIESHLSEETIKEDLEEVFSESKSKLAQARETNINVDKIKEKIRETAEAKKEGNFQKALETARYAKEEAELAIKIANKVNKGKRMVKQLKEKGIEYQPYLDTMKEAKEEADENDYETSLHLLESAIEEIQEEFSEKEDREDMISSIEETTEEEKERVEEGIEEEISEEEIKEIRSYLDEAKEIREKLLNFDVDLDDEDRSFEPAEKALEDGEIEESRERAKNVKKNLLDEVNNVLTERVKGAKDELKEAKLEDDIDVSKCIHLLKQAKNARENGDMEKVLSHLDEYRAELEGRA